jgi:hypothetical protein|tara:strand:+ start:1117 stop:1515 length:399 start_codon:yes stop_codon:yes gene_type:complete
MNKPEGSRSNEELLKELMLAFSSLKQKMEDPNYIALDNSMKNMLENQRDMKEDVKDLKRKLLNPIDGVIVNTNKNTEFRLDYSKLQGERDELEEGVANLKRWKAMYIKIFWTLFTGAIGVATFLIGESIINR